MKIHQKILLFTLPTWFTIFGVAMGTMFYASRRALREVAYYGLAAKTSEALDAARSVQAKLKNYNAALAGAGVVTVAVSGEQAKAEVSAAFQNIHPSKLGLVFAVDAEGKAVAFPRNHPATLKASDAPCFGPEEGQGVSVVTCTIAGTAYLATYSRLPGWDWIVIAAQPLSEVYGIVEATDKWVILILVLGGVALALVTTWLSRNITVPIRRLSEAAQAIGRGDRVVHQEIADEEEIGQLAESFNDMATKLQISNESRERAEAGLRDLNLSLEVKVKERTEELRQAQKVALDNAHAAGMAEVAVGVLHNIGNIATSVSVSAEEISRLLGDSKAPMLAKANALLKQNEADLPRFFSEGDKGLKLIKYYQEIEAATQQETQRFKEELGVLSQKVDLIKAVVQSQQQYAEQGLFFEEVLLKDVVEEVLSMQGSELKGHGVAVERQHGECPRVLVQRSKLDHILVNLLKNARESMDGMGNGERKITVRTGIRPEGNAFVSVADTGVGVEPANLNRIFNHGFTTKPNGHGFGLHFCANAMAEMGGRIAVESQGPGKGTRFDLIFGKERAKTS